MPVRPVLAASAGIFRDGRVLLIARAHEPMRGFFTFPGGKVKAGETLAEAVVREVREETGLEVALEGFADHVELITRDEHGVTSHYVIAAFAARWLSGEPTPNDEISEMRWVLPAEIEGLPVTPGLRAVVARVERLVA